jgi:hypothetical protein
MSVRSVVGLVVPIRVVTEPADSAPLAQDPLIGITGRVVLALQRTRHARSSRSERETQRARAQNLQLGGEPPVRETTQKERRTSRRRARCQYLLGWLGGCGCGPGRADGLWWPGLTAGLGGRLVTWLSRMRRLAVIGDSCSGSVRSGKA